MKTGLKRVLGFAGNGRRVRAGVLAGFAGMLALALQPAAALAKSVILYAGSYTTGKSEGIYAWRFDTATGQLREIGLAAKTPQPAHVWVSPNRKYLYTVNWEIPGSVSAYGIDRKTGMLTLLNRVGSAGDKPNQIVVDPTGRIATTTNYTSGTIAVFAVLPDGKLSEPFFHFRGGDAPMTTTAPGGSPKAHGVIFSPNGRYMYVADLGLDRLYAYAVDPVRRTVTPGATPSIVMHPGSGPRRLQISPDGRHLYVNHETDGEVSVFSVNGTDLREVQTISTLPAGTTIANKTAEIVLDTRGRNLYVSNRGHDSIAHYAVGDDGRLSLVEIVPAGGKTPRNLRIDPSGNYLLSANQDAGTISVLRIDQKTGRLTLTNNRATIDQPGGLYFLE